MRKAAACFELKVLAYVDQGVAGTLVFLPMRESSLNGDVEAMELPPETL